MEEAVSGVRGIVLVAGVGRRLRPHTDQVPKTLLEVAPDTTILDMALHNLASVGISEVLLVVGFAAHRIVERQAALETRHGVTLDFLHNDKAEDWNNAYSLWLAREHLGHGALVINGDTVHPKSVEATLLASRGSSILLAIDVAKSLGAEEMKVDLGTDGSVRRISKNIAPKLATGEYIGITLVEPRAADALTAALENTWRRDPHLYYEDGFQRFVDAGGEIGTVDVSDVTWVEVDDARDLERAKLVACKYPVIP